MRMDRGKEMECVRDRGGKKSERLRDYESERERERDGERERWRERDRQTDRNSQDIESYRRCRL